MEAPVTRDTALPKAKQKLQTGMVWTEAKGEQQRILEIDGTKLLGRVLFSKSESNLKQAWN